MRVFRAGTPASVTIPFQWGGQVVTPTAIAFRVTDEEGKELVPLTSLPLVADQADVTVTVDGVINALAAGQIRTMRVVELHMTDASGVCVAADRYVIEAEQTLVVMQNTYQTFESALLEAMDMPTLKAWPTKSDPERRAALIEAFHRLGKMKYRIAKGEYMEDELARLEPRRLQHINDLNERPLTEFVGYPSRFRQALRRAQIAEADVVLKGDIVGDRRREGLLSESIGESSMMFRSGKPVVLPVSSQALRYLQGYVTHAVNLGRG